MYNYRNYQEPCSLLCKFTVPISFRSASLSIIRKGRTGSEKSERRRRTIVLSNLNPEFSRFCFNCGFARIFKEPARASVRPANQRKQICGRSKKLRSAIIIVTISPFSSGSPRTPGNPTIRTPATYVRPNLFACQATPLDRR